jgi:hypothetical protein
VTFITLNFVLGAKFSCVPVTRHCIDFNNNVNNSVQFLNFSACQHRVAHNIRALKVYSYTTKARLRLKLIIIIIIIHFNSIHVYLRANVTAQRPITKLARVHRNTQN